MGVHTQMIVTRIRREIALGLVASLMVLSGCSTFSGDGPRGPNLGTAGTAKNFAASSSLAGLLTRADIAALETAFLMAADDPTPDPVSWEENASGTVLVRGYFIGNVLADPEELIETRSPIALDFALETERGDFVLAKNSNIRRGPSTDNAILETLPAGTGVEGIGKVAGEDWMLVASDNRVRGYVYSPLLEKAPGSDLLVLDGGPTRTPFLCREYEQSLNVEGQRDRWQGLVCDFGEGWEIAGRFGPTILGDAF